MSKEEILNINPSMEKEIEEVIKLIGKNQPNKVRLKGVVDSGDIFEDTLDYFEGTSVEDKVYDLYYTIELNPPDSMEMILVSEKVIEIV